MIWVLLFVLALAAMAVFTIQHKRAGSAPAAGTGGRRPPLSLLRVPLLVGNGALALLAALALTATSVVTPSGGEVGLIDRVYLCRPIEDGRNIALPGECGLQSGVIMPGFHFSPFVRVLNHISYAPMLTVGDGFYATLTARDGIKLDEGQVAARPWNLGVNTFTNDAGREVTGNMLDATFFLTDGMGRKGPQTTVLTPGRYPVNTHFWEVEYVDGNRRTTVPPGFVGVVKSAIDDRVVPAFMPGGGAPITCAQAPADRPRAAADGQMEAVIVPVGCRGVWEVPLGAGEYYLNTNIYTVTLVDTRVQNWTYRGGYTRKTIDLAVAEDGSIRQESSTEPVPTDNNAAGDVIAIKVEGWTVYQEVRIQARVRPAEAPRMVATVGNLQEVEDRIITPQVRSVLRNIGGSRITVSNSVAFDEAESELNALKARLEVLQDRDADLGLTPEQRQAEAAALSARVAGFELPDPNQEVTRPTRVLDFQTERQALERLVAREVEKVGGEAGIDIISVTLGNTDLPPELLVARKIEQLSGQLRNAYIQKRAAQIQRQATEAARARADQQDKLVTAQIAVETARLGVERRESDGMAERRFLEEQARGQEAQADVLGKERVALLRALEMLIENPALLTGLKLPNTVVFGGGGGALEGPAAILGGTRMFGGPAAPPTGLERR